MLPSVPMLAEPSVAYDPMRTVVRFDPRLADSAGAPKLIT